ncbi:2' O-ribose methyltransferase [Ceratobasidium sp. 395]|nr:2' O-ribose methyltransferase [Ceratobasidium sp. 395]
MYRSRSAFKLLEIDKRFKILRPGQVVCDLGAAPGGWSQVAARRLGIKPLSSTPQTPNDVSAPADPDSNSPSTSRQSDRKLSTLIAVDLLPMEPIHGVHFIQGDFTHSEVRHCVSRLVGDDGVDVVLSDMCANVTGTVKDVESSLQLCEMAFGFAAEHLKRGPGPKAGVLITKYFEHPDLLDFMKRQLKPSFGNVRTLRLAASRSESSEQYFMCTGFRG